MPPRDAMIDAYVLLLRRLVAGDILHLTIWPIRCKNPKCKAIQNWDCDAYWDEGGRSPKRGALLWLYKRDLIDINGDGEAFATDAGIEASRKLTYDERQERGVIASRGRGPV